MRYALLPLQEGRLLRRYKRFLADVELPGGSTTVHCPNSGSMAGLLAEGNRVRVSGPHGGKRKLPLTLEQIEITRPDGRTVWVGVNTSLPNRIVEEVARTRRLPGFMEYEEVQREVRLGDHSRIDLRLRGKGIPDAWVEVKNCTVVQEDVRDKTSLNRGDIATFPDAVTARGLKHLNLLIERVKAGERAAVVFTVQRDDAARFAPATAFDPAYAERFAEARATGVEMIPLPVDVAAETLTASPDPLPIHPTP